MLDPKKQISNSLQQCSVVVFLFSPKKFWVSLQDLKDPLYEGCNVLVLAKSRTKTCVLVCKCLDTYVDLWLCHLRHPWPKLIQKSLVFQRSIQQKSIIPLDMASTATFSLPFIKRISELAFQHVTWPTVTWLSEAQPITPQKGDQHV